jgi:hypothetical protein
MEIRFDPAHLEPLIRSVAEAVLAQRKEPQVLHEGRLCFLEEEAARMLGLEKHVLRDLRRRGEIDYCRIVGGRIAYTMEHLQKYLKDREILATS